MLSLLKCVGFVDVCWPWSCMLALECMLALFMCVYIVMHAGLIACWLIRLMVVLLYSFVCAIRAERMSN